MSQPQILFGHHATQMPAIARFVDHARFQVYFAPFEAVDARFFDLVVPLRLDQLPAARAALDRAGDGRRRGVVPPAALVELIDDKLAFNRWLIANGFADHVPPLLGDRPAAYPYLRKARRGTFGQGIRLIRGPEDGDVPDAGTFAQAVAPGRYEWVLHLLRVDGQTRYRLCYRYDMVDEAAIRGQDQAAAETVPDDPGDALPLCEAILAALAYEGTCCFNYKRDAAGRVQLIELNPRFGGSLVGEVSAYLAAHLAAL